MLAAAWASDLEARQPADDPIPPAQAAARRGEPLNGRVPKESLNVPVGDDLIDPSTEVSDAAVAGYLLRRFPVTAPRQVASVQLPEPPATFVGRESEVAAVLAMLRTRPTRLVTLTGPGGVGKSRLAVEVARRLVGEDVQIVRYISLDAVREPARVLPEIARQFGVIEGAADWTRAALLAVLGTRPTTLLLDNLEQVVDCGPELAALLAEAPELTILATSRAPLRIRTEREFPVPPLPVSRENESRTDDSRLSTLDSDAVALFVERVWAVNPAFALTEANIDDVAEICRRLDGVPLAIELAAARCAVLSPKALLARLDRRLTVLTGGPNDLPDRQRTIGRAIAWSYDLLSPGDRALIRRLAVFAGGFTLEAAEYVGGRKGVESPSVLDGLDRLVSHSLVDRVSGEGGSRFRLLETVREFAEIALVEADEQVGVADLHLHWCVALAEQAEPGLIGPHQRAWLERLDVEHDNIRAALTWALDSRRQQGISNVNGDRLGRSEMGLRLASALWRFWSARGFLREGQGWLQRAMEDAPAAAPAARANALNNLGNLACDLGDFPMARARYEAALTLRQMSGDHHGYATTASNLGLLAIVQGEFARAVQLLEESLRIRRELDDRPGIARSLGDLGDAALATGEVQRAEELQREALVVQQILGDDGGIAYALHNLAEVARHRGDLAEARRRYNHSIGLFREIGDQLGLGFPLVGLSRVAADEDRPAEAAMLLDEALTVRRAVGDRRGVVECLEATAGLAAPLGSAPVEVGVGLLGAASAMREALGLALPRAAAPARERLVASLRALLPGDRFAAAWAAGRARSPDATIAGAEWLLAHWAETERTLEGGSLKGLQPLGSSGQGPESAMAATLVVGDATALSEREVDVLRLVAEGYTNAEVAARLFLSPRTVHAHLNRIYNKLGVSTRSAATRLAVERGLV